MRRRGLSSSSSSSSVALRCAFLVAGLSLACAQSPAPPPQTAATAAPGKAATSAKPSPSTSPSPASALRLFPASEARSLLMASISMPSLDRTLAGSVALLSRAVPLPLDAAGVKEALLSQAGLPPQVGENLDTGTPAGVVVVATGGKDVAGLVIAVPAKGVEQARTVIAALGSIVGRRGDVVQVDNGSGGRGWVWQSANVIVLSDSIDALGRGAMLALDARRAGAGEDLTAIIYPEAIARAYGTNVKTALGAMVALARMARAAQLADSAKTREADGGGKGKQGKQGNQGNQGNNDKKGAKGQAAADAGKGDVGDAGVDHSLDVLEDLVAYAGDIGTLELGVAISERQGLITNLRVHPLPGTPLEKLTGDGKPFAIDPVLLRGSDDLADNLAFLGASSYGPFLRAQLARQRKRLAEGHDKGSQAAALYIDTVIEGMEGSWSGAGRFQPTPSFQMVYLLKDAASAAKVAEATAKIDLPTAMAFLKVQMAPDQGRWFNVKLKKETVGKLKAIHYTITMDSKAMPAATREAVKKVFGGATIDSYFGVAGTRALMTIGVGKEAKAKMVELARDTDAAPASRAPATARPPGAGGGALVAGANGELTDAVVAARGQDSFLYFDFSRVLGMISSLSDEPRAKAMAAGARAPIPTYLSFASDAAAKQMTFSWTVPPAAFAGAGAILQSLSATAASK
jgi:hypothetical protein